MNTVPDLWRGLEEYKLADATFLWAHVFADVPLRFDKDDPQIKYQRDINAAMAELREHVRIQRRDGFKPKVLHHIRSGRAGGSWDEHTKVPIVTEYITGPDLAAYAKERGKPGVFGFEEEPPSRIEWGFTHDTELLKAVRWVVGRYWEGAEKKEWPTKREVLDDLKTQYPDLSHNECDAVDLVARHDNKRNKAR